jgi:hypothetical protein
MHKNFGEWYRLVTIEPLDDQLKKRWAGVLTWAATISTQDHLLIETIRIFRGLPVKASREEFLAAFRGHDNAFLQRNNDLELRVLAGAALVQCVLPEIPRTESEIGLGEDIKAVRPAILVGTALEASAFLATDTVLDEITSEVRAGLHKIAKQYRSRRNFNISLIAGKAKEELKSNITAVNASTEHGNMKQPVYAALMSMNKVLGRVENALEGAAHSLRCADEETNILWWLTGGRSRDLNEAWAELKDAAPILAGFELADLTDIALGPQNASAILGRIAGMDAKPLQTFLEAVPEAWSKEHTRLLNDRYFDLTPISLALSLRSSSNATSWQSYFEAATKLKPSVMVTPERAAYSAYVESMLFRILAKGG